MLSGGKIKIPPIGDTPEELRKLLSQTEVNAQGERVFIVRTHEFLHRIRAYNDAASFIPLGAKIDDTIMNNAHGVVTLSTVKSGTEPDHFCQSKESGLNMHRCGCMMQFPLRLAFAITINKTQGQTLNHVGVVLNELMDSCMSPSHE